MPTPVRAAVTTSILLAAAAAVTACGGSDSAPYNPPVAPPTGAFNDGSLDGTYVVSFSGTDTSGGDGSFFALAGTLTADGGGMFTTGTIDLIDPSLSAALGTSYTLAHLAASGTYNVTADGRGTGTISLTINGTAVQMGIDFVLTSGAHGLISRFDASGSGSGSLDEMSNASQASLAGSYAFSLGGLDTTGGNFMSTVGAVTLDGNGNVTSGVEDFSDNGDATNLQALPVQGSLTVGTPGSAQLITSAASFGTLHFDAWVIDTTHIKLIETDSTAYLAGDAFLSTGHTAFPSGPLVFSLSGEDTAQLPFSAGGLLTSDDASQITGGLEDVNDAGYIAQSPSVTGGFTSNGPRTTLTLDGIYNGYLSGSSPIAGNYTFAAYPYNGGVALLEIDNGAGNSLGISGGNAFLQTATALGSGQGYALNLSGGNQAGEVDMIGQLTITGSSASGIYDVNNLGLLITDASLGSGSLGSASANGSGTIQFPSLQTTNNSYINTLSLTYFVVDQSSAVFLETDSGQTATGTLLLQNGSAAPPPALFHQLPLNGPSASK
ncbi:MAG: hypothetical protein ACYDAE_08620 [Steroidobacteraceae bacterium]